MAKAATPLTIPSLPILFLLSLSLSFSLLIEKIYGRKKEQLYFQSRGERSGTFKVRILEEKEDEVIKISRQSGLVKP